MAVPFEIAGDHHAQQFFFRDGVDKTIADYDRSVRRRRNEKQTRSSLVFDGFIFMLLSRTQSEHSETIDGRQDWLSFGMISHKVVSSTYLTALSETARCSHIVLFKSPRDKQQISVLARQVIPAPILRDESTRGANNWAILIKLMKLQQREQTRRSRGLSRSSSM